MFVPGLRYIMDNCSIGPIAGNGIEGSLQVASTSRKREEREAGEAGEAAEARTKRCSTRSGHNSVNINLRPRLLALALSTAGQMCNKNDPPPADALFRQAAQLPHASA